MTGRWGAGLAVAALLLVAAAGGAGGQERDQPIVTPSVQVTGNPQPARAHNQPQMLVHPEDENILVIIEAEFLSSTCHVHVSRDGGRTWTKASGAPVPPDYKACARPTFGPYLAADFGVDGTLYVVGAGSDSGGSAGPTDAYVARSTDLGETWEYTVIAESEEVEFERADGSKISEPERFGYIRMAVHPTDPNLVYAGFRYQPAEAPFAQVPVRSLVAVSQDRGRTWSEPVDIMEQTFPREEVYGSDVPSLAVAPDGTIYAFTKERPPPAPPSPAPAPAPAPQPSPAPGAPSPIREPAVSPPTPSPSPTPEGPAALCRPAAAGAEPSPTPSPTASPSPPPAAGAPGAGARLLMSKSTDNGRTWKASVVDDSGVVCVPCLTTPEAELDPKTGAVYVVFEQSESPPPNARDDRNIFFMRSTDGGETWSEREQLNDDVDPDRVPNYDQFFPGIDVAPNGRVDVAWYDFRTDALFNPAGTGKTDRSEETCWDVFFTSSGDGGQTWAENVRVSDRTMNQNEGYVLNLAYDLRGPIGVASTDRAAHIAWSDSRAGSMDLPVEDAYFASVLQQADQEGWRGSPRLASLVTGVAVGLLVAGVAVLGVALSLRRGRGVA